MKITLTAIIMTTMLLTYALPASADDNGWQRVVSLSDDDDHDDNRNYREECGSCHFAYQPGLLPVRSWQKLMSNLENHFGNNAELEAKVQQTLTDYLVKNAANFSRAKFSVIVRGLSKKQTPLRISELPYFVREHDEIPKGMVQDNPEVKSFSNCDKCHTAADKGDYSEDNISISGYGGWED